MTQQGAGFAGWGPGPVGQMAATCRARAPGCAGTFSQGEPPSLETVCSAELTGEEWGLLSPGPGAKHGAKTEGAGRPGLTVTPTPKALRGHPSPSAFSGGRREAAGLVCL